MDGRTATYMVTCLRGGIEVTLFWDGRTDSYLRGDVLERRNGKHVVLRRTDGRTATYMVTCLRGGIEDALFWDGRTYMVTCLRAGMENTLFWDGRTATYVVTCLRAGMEDTLFLRNFFMTSIHVLPTSSSDSVSMYSASRPDNQPTVNRYNTFIVIFLW